MANTSLLLTSAAVVTSQPDWCLVDLSSSPPRINPVQWPSQAAYNLDQGNGCADNGRWQGWMSAPGLAAGDEQAILSEMQTLASFSGGTPIP